MVSESTNNILGVIGGVILAGCLIPQTYKLFKTKSASDLSYIYLILYIIGLAFMTAYLVGLDDAAVAVISIFVEGAIAVITICTKLFFDKWGPNPSEYWKSRSNKAALTLPAAVFTDISKALTGHGGAPFPVANSTSNSGHAAQHLLLDISIKQASNSIDVEAASDTVLSKATELIEQSRTQVGLEVEKRQFKQLKSFSSRSRVAAAAADQGHEMCFIGVCDGYVTLIWDGASRILSVDLYASADVALMNEAAQLFGQQLLDLYPGSIVEASLVPRMRPRN